MYYKSNMNIEKKLRLECKNLNQKALVFLHENVNLQF